ncbi:MAG TPA: CBS domain-containing protein [Candidatus Flavonifractor merdipullorum]|uniref:CBS domain-containing protein n=1 Tax=Candidatus Flavonifractor merdipullorum TaxID=2838590 RepID=A0A9D1UMV6_9FIRM|nr:CBS domain-containing protein [Candidatus Flavonifractor merdipullorum]
MRVRELMSDQVVSVTPGESAALAARLLDRREVGALPVCGADGRLQGIVTDRDIVLRCVAAGRDPAHTPVSQIMSRNCAWVTPGAETTDAAQVMGAAQVRRLPVVERGKVVGMLSLGDLVCSHSCDAAAGAALLHISRNIR